MYHPSRGGVRGGRDQFNWDDVKGDKHRENYLGHSIKAPVGRWQKGKDLHWYTRDRHSEDAAAREEIKRIQEEEDEAMQEMLGLAPKKVRQQVNQLGQREVSELMKKIKDGESSAPSHAAGERVEGLGFAPAPGQTAPGQVGAKKSVNVEYERDSATLATSQVGQEVRGLEAERDVRQDGLAIVEVQAATVGRGEDERSSSSSEEGDRSRRTRKEERLRAKEQRRGEKRILRNPSSSEEDDAPRKRRKEERRRAKEERREEKRARKQVRKETLRKRSSRSDRAGRSKY